MAQFATKLSVPNPVRSIRSTLLLSARASLVAAGHFERYEQHLSPETRAGLGEIIAGTWLPIRVGVEHYAACDALGLSRQEQTALGRRNGERLSGTLLGTLAKLARSAGTTPPILMDQFSRFWGRIFEGGSLSCVPRGPKDAEIIVNAPPLIQSTHFRHGLGGTAESILSLVCARLFVRVRSFDEADGVATYLIQWV